LGRDGELLATQVRMSLAGGILGLSSDAAELPFPGAAATATTDVAMVVSAIRQISDDM